MEIKLFDSFDLYGNGTLVLRTVMDPMDENFLFSWDVQLGDQTLYRGDYSSKPFTALKVDRFGHYLIRSYVLDRKTKEKMIHERYFDLNQKTSPDLKSARKERPNQQEEDGTEKPTVINIGGPFWLMRPSVKYPEEAKYSWYIYRYGSSKPFEKQSYSTDRDYVCRFQESGNYYVKLSVLVGEKKLVSISNSFEVSLEE